MVPKADCKEESREDKIEREREDDDDEEEEECANATILSPAELDGIQKRKNPTSVSKFTPEKSAEDRKTEAALSFIDTRNIGDDDSALGSKNRDNIDQEAVRRAIERLASISTREKPSKETPQQQQQKQQQVNGFPSGNNKNVKADLGDVALMVEELEISKNRATDLLKASEGNIQEALRRFILPDVMSH